MSIAERLAPIERAIAQHAPGRDVTLVAVTKYATVEQMREAYAAGIRHFGENKLQDALAKQTLFPADEYPELRWHFIGTLQRNKIRKTVGHFALIHSIDSIAQTQTLSELNAESGRRQRVLLQVNLSGDSTRNGLPADQIRPMLEQMLSFPGIEPRGLMTLASPEASMSGDLDSLKPFFCGLRDLRDELEGALGIALPDLSMGMSHDFPQALECGATIIRVGNLLFKN